MVVLLFSILRGIRFPNIWSYSHFLFNYDFGFTKRSLVGALIGLLGHPYLITYDFFFRFATTWNTSATCSRDKSASHMYRRSEKVGRSAERRPLQPSGTFTGAGQRIPRLLDVAEGAELSRVRGRGV
jgi:hypothetical protein